MIKTDNSGVIARIIVEEAFKYKTDKSGKPYLGHLIRVAERARNLSPLSGVYTVGLLHDLIEDCPEWSIEKLAIQFDDHIVKAVQVLTKKKDEPYTKYINKIAENDIARTVKIADLEDNMDLTRLSRQLTEKDLQRTAKYHNAYLKLTRKNNDRQD